MWPVTGPLYAQGSAWREHAINDVSIISIAPPLVAIVLVLTTKKVLLSLGAGVLSAAFIVADYHPFDTLRLVWDSFVGLVYADGAVDTTYPFILIFTLALGMITALILMAGGSAAFSEWAVQRIHSRRGAQGLAAVLGLVIFIDDYFNALAVGQVARPVTDRMNVARAKLAYLIDSTSAPVAVLAPFSSWGASIIGIMSPIIAASTIPESDVMAFVKAAGMNYYAIAAILTVGLVVTLGIDIGPMRGEERRALEEGKTYDRSEKVPGELAEDLPVHSPGAKRALVIPFLALVGGVLGGIVWTGYRAGGSWSVLDLLAETDVTAALLYGAVLGLGTALYYYLRYTSSNPRFGRSTLGQGLLAGIRSMLPAVYILVLAWLLGSLITAARHRRVPRGRGRGRRHRAAVAGAGDVRDGRGDGVLHRHLVGLLRHPAADRRRHHELRGRARAAAARPRCGARRGGLRRPLLADLRHHDPVLHRRELQRDHARHHPAPVRPVRRRGRPGRLRRAGAHRQRRARPRGGRRSCSGAARWRRTAG